MAVIGLYAPRWRGSH
ncbi:hypothetical protein [Caulobacter vibrioides]|uniref:Uncharacterized protein n=1 Tax=Caulobacter vibrioides (strain NA1000 / CB15N) TaxID=565050 RepID=A0A0H3IXL3_CAUVN|nr:hypothetical protein [Caulobacter vibrioides]YP_009020484.1 hypothetical protein CCNA_03913 [Caulobacter vibrioides NA1000]QBQ57492.1 hypothetical protein EUX21_00125 [synthetic Caulobacter sp. 'ethensis']AHI88515.1 hypothetical protein CCNA_03913 [Caulobacter vibrioides NA1000]AVH77114.1 hypothetical protein CA607_20165 [Caulobacter vibrioides]QXZ53898.1 hypothetical protein KZH45_00325 [Caulobacter vibrioides]